MNKKPKHTPCPWRSYGHEFVHGPDCVVAIVGGSKQGFPDATPETIERWKADIALICAAPKLLHALESVALRHEEDGPCYCAVRTGIHHLSCLQARAALSNARGNP